MIATTPAWRCLGYRLTKNGDSVENGRLLHHPSNVARFSPTATEILNAENPTATLAWGVSFSIEKNEGSKTCRWIGRHVVPRASWLSQSLEWLEENDEIIKYWKSIGVDYQGIFEEINNFRPPISAALVCAYGAFGQCGFGLFVADIEHPHVLLTTSWPPGSVPTVYCRGNATSQPVIAEYLTYRGLNITGFAPTLPPSHLTLKTTSSFGRYVGASGSEYYASPEDLENFAYTKYAIPEPYASVSIPVGEKSIGSEENVTGYKSAELVHAYQTPGEFDDRSEYDFYPTAHRFLCTEVELSWAFPDELFEEAASITFSGEGIAGAQLLLLRTDGGDADPYPYPSSPGESTGTGGIFVGGTMTGKQLLDALGITGDSRLKGTLTCYLCAGNGFQGRDALTPGESITTSLSWTDSPTVTPSSADTPGGWTEYPLTWAD